jgi:hypothetical protein
MIRKVKMPLTTISAQTVVNVSVSQAQDWFLSLKDHPERYRFATHAGFEFVQGNFGDVRARFKTREKFYFLKQELLFELVEVDEASFRFRLLSPSWLHVWGAFIVQELSLKSIALRLEIGSTTQYGQLWLRFYPLAAAIRRQITQEVTHIKASMEEVVAGMEDS